MLKKNKMKAIIPVLIAVFAANWIIFAQPDAKQDVSDTLDALHKAEASGNIEGFLAVWGEDSVFLGTDASEAWPKAEFAKDIGERFAAGGSWTFDIMERSIGVDGNTAWFKEVVRYKEGGGFILRPTGTMIKRDGKWKIVQLHMGVPVPNDVYGAAVQGYIAHENGKETELKAAGETLDALHALASTASWDEYGALFTKDATFLGTDVSEIWTREELIGYGRASKSGWTYAVRERNIHMMPGYNAVRFDEVLTHEQYGILRGTGTLARVRGTWKIAQYNLTWPVPNDLALDVSQQILLWQAEMDEEEK